MLEPTELVAAVVSGWATAWAMTTLGVPAVPSLFVGLLIWATVTGRYRSRWAPPAPPPTPEPGSGPP